MKSLYKSPASETRGGGRGGEERHISGVTSKKRKHNFPAGARARRRPKNGSSFSPWRSEWLRPRSLKCDISRHSQLRGLLFPRTTTNKGEGRGGAGRGAINSVAPQVIFHSGKRAAAARRGSAGGVGSGTFGNGGHEAFLPPGPVAVGLLVVAVFPVVHLRGGGNHRSESGRRRRGPDSGLG